jgi:2-polyprenyl-3-methyl-5-hydroxy-6-metoxy-1,4-benzoquinol methylase
MFAVSMKKDLSLDSGERINFVDEGLLYTDCLARYQWIERDLQDANRPLVGADVFCGNGYGSNILARSLDATIFAIDGSSESIAQAAQSYLRANLFFAAKLFPFELPHGMFDFVASIESLEHVREYQAFAAMLCRSLRPGGRLYVSAPNEERLVLSRMNYRWHHHHFVNGELDELFHRHGMAKVKGMSTNARVHRDGNDLWPYPYQTYGEMILPEGIADTHLMVYERR